LYLAFLLQNKIVTQLKSDFQKLKEKDESLEKEVKRLHEELEAQQTNIANFLESPCQHGKPFYENHFRCQCDEGWTGDKCHLDIDECQSNKCQNGGVCTNLLGDYTCDCSNTVYTGKYCHIIEGLAGQLGVTGTDVNHRNELKETPLHIAAKNDFLKAAKHLIENGANLEAKDKWGDTPLHEAGGHNGLQVAQLLIQEGADVEARGEFKDTPLHSAVKNKDRSILVAKLLIENGADLEAKDKWGDSPLHHSASQNAPQVALLLIQEGANVEAEGNNGWTPLHWAAYKNSLQAAKVLVQEGQANKDAEDDWGRKPIDHACNRHPNSSKCSKMRNLLQ